MTFKAKIDSGATLLADGATGTLLQNIGLPVGDAPERWTLENPSAVREVARRYAEAGSDLIYTNTFGACRVRLERAGLADKFGELNRRAVALAREGVALAKSNVFVVGAIGPTGELLEPYGELPQDNARAAFLEQATELSDAGVDAFVCESFSDLTEALLALDAVKFVAKVPVMVSMTFEPGGRTMMGVTPEDAVAQLSDAGAAVVGANCSVGPDVVEQVMRAMKLGRTEARLLAKPNAGLPKVADGKAIYELSPDAMAAFASRMNQLGVGIIGGCCGTTPEHIRAMRQVL